MESVLSILSNADNVRLLVYIVAVFCGYVLINSRMGRMEYSLNKRIDEQGFSLSKRIDGVETSLSKRIDGVEASVKELSFSVNKRIDEVETSLSRRIDGVEASVKELSFSVNKRIDDLKYNDFAHLNSTIEALTYALEKNGSLKTEDKDYVDSRLAH